MRRFDIGLFATFTLACMTFAGTVRAADVPVNQSFDHYLSSGEKDFVSLAEAMPAEAYQFAPTKGAFSNVRTFAQQVKHVAAVNYMVAAAMLGEKIPVDLGEGGEAGPNGLKSKQEIVSFLKDSFVYLHKAMKSLTADKLTQSVQSPFGKGQMTVAALAIEGEAHCFDHYGQIVVYARMNGIVPPASR